MTDKAAHAKARSARQSAPLRNWRSRNCVSSPIPPGFKASPLSSTPYAHNPFACNFSQPDTLSLGVVCRADARGNAPSSMERTSLCKFPVSRIAFQVPQNKQFTAEPCLQPIENREFVPNTPGGMGRGPAWIPRPQNPRTPEFVGTWQIVRSPSPLAPITERAAQGDPF